MKKNNNKSNKSKYFLLIVIIVCLTCICFINNNQINSYNKKVTQALRDISSFAVQGLWYYKNDNTKNNNNIPISYSLKEVDKIGILKFDICPLNNKPYNQNESEIIINDPSDDEFHQNQVISATLVCDNYNISFSKSSDDKYNFYIIKTEKNGDLKTIYES